MANQPLSIANPRIEYLTNPLGIDRERPRFLWIVSSDEPNQKQLGYQIRVSSAEDIAEADLWDTGRVESNATNQIEYGGPILGSSQRAWWSVRVWNQDDQVSDWIEPQFWEAGLLEPLEWTGK